MTKLVLVLGIFLSNPVFAECLNGAEVSEAAVQDIAQKYLPSAECKATSIAHRDLTGGELHRVVLTCENRRNILYNVYLQEDADSLCTLVRVVGVRIR